MYKNQLNFGLSACFVDLEKAYDRVYRDKLEKILKEYGVDGQLLTAIKSFYCGPEVCVRVKASNQSCSMLDDQLDLLDDVELDGPIIFRILHGIPWDFTQAK